MSIVKTLISTTSSDNNHFQSGHIKYIIDIIAPVLTYLFNLVLETGLVPKLMQISKLTVLHKEENVNNFGNYWPISILPAFF